MPETTKGSIVLAKPADWWLWICYIEDLAAGRCVWIYMDPDGQTPEPIEPVEPVLADFDVDSIRQLCQNGRLAEWKATYRLYESRMRRYEKQMAELGAMRDTIIWSIPREQLLRFGAGHSVRYMLISL